MRLKELFSARDMTQGAPWKRIMEFSIPMLLGNIAQQLYNTADSVIVGHYVGDNALAAVGSAGPILNLLLALFVGISTGAGIVVSQSFGARDREGLSRGIGNCISLTFLATVFIMIFGEKIAPYDPYKNNLYAIDMAPCREHLMGTDALGRDLFSRGLTGARSSLGATFAVVTASHSI